MKTFNFTVSDAKGPVCGMGTYHEGAGVSFAVGDGFDRTMVEQAVNYLAAERAAVSCDLMNGWTVARVPKGKTGITRG